MGGYNYGGSRQSGGYFSNRDLFDFDANSYYDSFSTYVKPKPKDDIIYEDISWYEERKMEKYLRTVPTDIPVEEMVESDKYIREMEDKIDELPEYVSRDLFKLFYNKKIDYKIDSTRKKFWHKTLSVFDNYLLKSVTRDKVANSSIVMRACLEAMIHFQDQNKKDDESFEDMMKRMSGAGMQEMEQNMDSLQNQAEMAHKEAGAKIDQQEEKQRKMADLGFDVGSMGEDELATLKEFIDNHSHSLPSKKEFDKFIFESIKTIQSGLSGTCVIEEESIFDADEIEDVDDIFNLTHPALFQDVTNINKKYFKSFDLYLDKSGSMGGQMSVFEEAGDSIDRLTLCKLITMKLMNMDIIDDVYVFASSVHKSNKKDIMGVSCSGGTSINRVRKNISETQKASLIITDGEADFSEDVTEDVFILCIGCHPYNLDHYYEHYPSFAKLVKDKRVSYMEDCSSKMTVYNPSPKVITRMNLRGY